MYTRAPQKKPTLDDPTRETPKSIQLPKNYSGNAFSSDGIKLPIGGTQPPSFQISAPEVEPLRHPHLSPSVTPQIPKLEKDIKVERRPEPPETEVFEPPHNERENAYKHHAYDAEKITPPSSSIFSSLIPHGAFTNNFPFGHGIGYEELLILGIMLSIYVLGEADSEIMMLLSILLFAG